MSHISYKKDESKKLSERAVLLPQQIDINLDKSIGGKAVGLTRLQNFGAAIPAWFVIPDWVFNSCLVEINIHHKISKELENLPILDLTLPESLVTLSKFATSLQQLIESIWLPNDLLGEIDKALNVIGSGPFAVRSSVVGEDSLKQSFAGIFRSYLLQRDTVDVSLSIKKCWISAFSASALLYRMRLGHKLDLPRIGVIVQRMITGQVSGVAFTKNSHTDSDYEVVIGAAWGLGEGIVNGICNTDEYIWSPKRGEISINIGNKDRQIIPLNNGMSGTHLVQVSQHLRNRRCINTEQVTQIGKEGIRLANLFECALDIEWTLDGETLYLLQARPITTYLETL